MAEKLAKGVSLARIKKNLSNLVTVWRMAGKPQWWPEKGFGIAQLEVFEVDKFLERLAELTEILEGLKEKYVLRYILNLPEIRSGKSYWIFPSKGDVNFFLGRGAEDLVVTRPLILRKQILEELLRRRVPRVLG